MNARQTELTLWGLGLVGLLVMSLPHTAVDPRGHDVRRVASAGIEWQLPGLVRENIEPEPPRSTPAPVPVLTVETAFDRAGR
jgi:hypothetical protein